MQQIQRKLRIKTLFPTEPAFRLQQIWKALFDPSVRGWDDISTLPKAMREVLSHSLPFLTVKQVALQTNLSKDTFKALLEVEDGEQIETVLMKNRRGAWTICVSSQVGCAMNCSFCATGKMGLKRNLTSDEIVDQYRFWMTVLSEHPEMEGRISNIVYMGMGEPLSNYENVKESLNTLLAETDIGKTRITVSTVGVLPRLEQILTDPDWPHVRFAISLHSANTQTRKSIVPSSYDDFLPKLQDWGKRYLETFGNRRHHLTFEYVLLRGINDSTEDAEQLAAFVKGVGNVRVNLIPYNFTGSHFSSSTEDAAERMKHILENTGITVTIRKSMGQDIAAACGQLAKTTASKEDANLDKAKESC